MKYVLDASVALKWVLNEPDSGIADRFRDDVRNGVHALIAPDVFPIEAGHALTRAERRGLIPIGSAEAHWLDILTTAPTFFACLPLMRRAMAVSSQARIGVYDCLYIALAEREGCPLVTADDRLVRTFPGGSVVPLSNL
jgi:predicted nucleic acid-binding protein